MTGTCLVPSGDFTLEIDDLISISIDGIGTLINKVAQRNAP
jgi:2-dehydro-3-deoxy-D-arabinonate dehydratase